MNAGREFVRSVGMAVVLFIMLNGVVLIVLGGPDQAASEGADVTCERDAVLTYTDTALVHVQQARHTLDAMNYGETRIWLNEAERGIIELRNGL